MTFKVQQWAVVTSFGEGALSAPEFRIKGPCSPRLKSPLGKIIGLNRPQAPGTPWLQRQNGNDARVEACAAHALCLFSGQNPAMILHPTWKGSGSGFRSPLAHLQLISSSPERAGRGQLPGAHPPLPPPFKRRGN